jgi:DNA-binding XRE family transcriptional regulator
MGNRLREFRCKSGMSISDLSKKSDVSRMTIWKLENNAKQAYTTRTLIKLANALGKPVKDVFDLKETV